MTGSKRFARLLGSILGGLLFAGALLAWLAWLPSSAQAAPAPRAPVVSANPAAGYPLLPADQFFVYLPLIQTPPCMAAPTLITPTNGAQTLSLIGDLYYRPGTDTASSTSLDIANNPAFQPAQRYTTGGSGPLVIHLRLFDNLQPATIYYWRVQDTCGAINSPFSTVFTFVAGSGGTILPAPSQASPVSGTTNVQSQQLFVWNAVAGADGYQLWVCSSNTCGVYFTANTAYNLTGLDPNAAYVWYVKAYNSYAYGDPSASWDFTTGAFVAALAPTAGPGLPLPPGYRSFALIDPSRHFPRTP